MPTDTSWQAKLLRRKSSDDDYRVYRAGLEWALTDPIVIESRKDLKSENRWRDLVEPFHHQVKNLMTFCRRLPVTLLADDVGLGKTISAGLIVSELIARGRLTKILVVCPKLLAPQWQEELLTKFDIESTIATGRKLISADPEETGAVITTYNSARMYLESVPSDRFQMLILDEAHKLRNLYGVDPPPQVATKFREALQDRRFRFVLMLTATPIQNRLWDIYSLVDLLTVARGHENPFGSEGMFTRRFIGDSREQARQLKPQAREEFRSIVYGYMSRIRRGDAKLHFPDRVVQMHRVEPTAAELRLISTIAKPIQKLNRLAQISILQALTSSPDALSAQLNTMARNGTVPSELAETVRTITATMPPSAKLRGLGALIEKLQSENASRWRLVVFTCRLETQTTIQAFLESRGLKVGIINGSSGRRNQETIARFRANPPECHVIVSTEAGSEGVNLQVANVLVNYDLPWNPMIVEQRIGRVQRLASEHANVSIFNVMLSGTFEEYIVGRLMEKLQMASHAIGDIEALLEASGMDGENGSAGKGFDERIRELVVAALEGKDVTAAVRQSEESITEAKVALEREQESINQMLGSMNGTEYIGPKAPTLPATARSMTVIEFVSAALQSLGARVSPASDGIYLVEEVDGGHEHICFSPDRQERDRRATLYTPETGPFQQLVGRVTATGVHDVTDTDHEPLLGAEVLAKKWVEGFGATFRSIEVEKVRRCFAGKAVVHTRATVAHDSYERLVEVSCSPLGHFIETDRSGAASLPSTLENPRTAGVNVDELASSASRDAGISEFYRFYLERRAHEVKAAGGDERKRKKLEDEFTPRLQMTLVALEGTVHRKIVSLVRYVIDGDAAYTSAITVSPQTNTISDTPALATCALSGLTVPQSCLGRCDVSGKSALRHRLLLSEVSSRKALPEFTAVCSVTGKRALKDEVEPSAATGQLVISSLLRTSAVSGKRAEPHCMGRCEFTHVEALNSELAVSEITGKRYRSDEQVTSDVSGKTGHRSEYTFCEIARKPIAIHEAETCEVTGKHVRRGALRLCDVTHKRVLPSEIGLCMVTGKSVLKQLLVKSSQSPIQMQSSVGIRSANGKLCAPVEAKACAWSGKKRHPEDLRACVLTGKRVAAEFVTDDSEPRLHTLLELLNGTRADSDRPDLWNIIASRLKTALGGSDARVAAAMYSHDRRYLAVCAEVKEFLGLRKRHVGFLYSIADQSVFGRIVQGRRSGQEWTATTK